MPGSIYVVATPIGNLEDITYRALRVLKHANLIAAEDTRRTRNLLSHFGITTRLVSYREQNHRRIMPHLLSTLEAGGDVALVTDAGTPGVSDPGGLLIREAVAVGAPIVPIPGPSAVASALSAAGLPADQYMFAGFLPPKTKARRDALEKVKNLPWTLVFFEAPHRLAETLEDMALILGDRDAVICRELTKINEELVRGQLMALSADISRRSEPIKGEITMVVAGAGPAEKILLTPAEVHDLVLNDPRSVKEIVTDLTGRTTLNRTELYRQVLAAKAESRGGGEAGA